MEKWEQFYTIEQLHCLQKIEMQNMRVLDTICKNLGIEYFVYGGTLLGTVKFHGFIPWDDDLDVAMLRDDYMKFVSEAYKWLPDNYYLQTPYNDIRSPFPYTKLRLKDTRYAEYGYHRMKTEQGIYIDIYPIDNIPDAENEVKKQHARFHRLARIFAWRQCAYSNNNETGLVVFLKRSIRMAVSVLLRMIPQKILLQKMDTIATTYNGMTTKRQGNYFFPSATNFFSGVLPFKKADFGGFEINIPNDWESNLIARYGDYKQMPPEEKRVGHKPYILELGKYWHENE